MSKLLPYFRWYPADAESDSKYAALSLPELGLFHRCINFSWMNDGLPSSPVEIGRVLRITPREIKSYWPRVSECFILQEDRHYNRRQESEREYARTKSERATESVRSRYGRNTSEGTDDLPRAYESGSEETTILENTSIPKNSLKREAEDWFTLEFWLIWPHKVGKEQAKKEASKIKPEDREMVLRAVREHSARIIAMDRPIHPATWLSGKRWEDDPVAVQAAMTRTNGTNGSNGNGHLFAGRESATEKAIRIGNERIAKQGYL